MIPVTKPYLPNRAKLNRYLDGIYERQWLTNNGPLTKELKGRLEEYLGVSNLLLVSNGTLALQVAYRSVGISSHREGVSTEAITSPFTFIATASSLKWEGIEPVFSDIDPHTWCLSPGVLESAITPITRGIIPVHIYGNACDVDSFTNIANQHRLHVIYDASHAFGIKHQGKSILSYGDASTLSFHATKLFHTVEGGAIVFKDRQTYERAEQIINFGISGPDEISELGINAKMNEIQAAIGLCVLDDIESIIQKRSDIWHLYASKLHDICQLQHRTDEDQNNYSYFPILLPSESKAKEILRSLSNHNISARRYFYPSLNTVGALQLKHPSSKTTISMDISSRILCLPMYHDLSSKSIQKIIDIVIAELSS
ncbi:MAG: DegT/DnrJ/EryC1/StrS family aminotransferase [Candidatus Thiodiazotropha sp.]